MSTMGSTKSQGKGKLLMCFKPTFDGDDDGPAASSFSSSGRDESSGGRSKKRARRSFYVVVKAVLFSTSMLMKKEDPNKKKFVYLTSKSKRFVKSMKKFSYKSCWEPGQEIDMGTDSSSSSFLSAESTCHTTPSTLSSSSSLSTSLSVKLGSNRINGTSDSIDSQNSMSRIVSNKKEMKSMKRGWARKCVQNFNSTLEMSLIVVCLVALIFGGKAFATLICTLMLLLFSPRRRRSRRCERLNGPNNNDRRSIHI